MICLSNNTVRVHNMLYFRYDSTEIKCETKIFSLHST